MRVAHLLLPWLLSIGCGGPAKPAAKQPDPIKDPIPKTAGPPCGKVAAHIAQIASAGKVDPDGKIEKFFAARCSTDAWSDEARSCFAAIENDAESEGCINKLTDAQRDAMNKAADAAASGGAVPAAAAAAPPPPPPAPGAAAPTTRGLPKKKPTGGADPCQGGE